jgi:hypothetical protein
VPAASISAGCRSTPLAPHSPPRGVDRGRSARMFDLIVQPPKDLAPCRLLPNPDTRCMSSLVACRWFWLLEGDAYCHNRAPCRCEMTPPVSTHRLGQRHAPKPWIGTLESGWWIDRDPPRSGYAGGSASLSRWRTSKIPLTAAKYPQTFACIRGMPFGPRRLCRKNNRGTRGHGCPQSTTVGAGKTCTSAGLGFYA